MILCEIFLLGCAFILCGMSVWTDLRHGQIKNKHLIIAFTAGLVLNVIYYAVYCQDCLGITALNLLISALLSIGFYFVHIWSAGDSKLMIVLISLCRGGCSGQTQTRSFRRRICSFWCSASGISI